MSHTLGLDFGDEEPRYAAQTTHHWLDDLPPEASILRVFQTKVVKDIAAGMHSWRRILVQSPCRSGKTTMFCVISAAGVRHELSVLVLATRTKLVRQINDRMDELNIRHGVIAAEMPHYRLGSARVQIASVDTLYRRCITDKKMPLPKADIVIFDEAHLALGTSRQRILDEYPNAWKFGFTATPWGSRLRQQFDTLVLGPEIKALIKEGWLVPPRIFNKETITEKDIKKLRIDKKTNDYAPGDSSKLMSRPKIVGDVVANWLSIANGDATLVFACDKSHGAFLLVEFLKAGIAAEQVTDEDDEDTREAIMSRSEQGITKVVINCFLFSYGVDFPWITCVVLARPTRSLVMYLQSVWRGGTPFPGKKYFKVIDHGRVIRRLRSPTYDRDWSLDMEKKSKEEEEREERERNQREEAPMHCAECSCEWLVTEEGKQCPNCGWVPKPVPKAVKVIDAVLEESPDALPPVETVQEFFQQAIYWYSMRYPAKWQEKPNSIRFMAWAEARRKHKRPDDERIPSKFWSLDPLPASPEVAGWLKSQVIRYAKARERDAKIAAQAATNA